MQILACATQGTGGDDEKRLRTLLSAFEATFFEFDKREKRASAIRLLRALGSRKFDLFVLEGSGIAGGLAAILGRIAWNVPFVLSSGDAVGPFLSSRYPYGKPLFFLYEKCLCAYASGFIGWTPYLVGRALTYGVPRAITIPGWAPQSPDRATLQQARQRIRNQLQIPDDAVVFGLIGSLNWSDRLGAGYGSELVHAARLARNKPYVLVVGDGSGLAKLRAIAGDALDKTILLPGRVPREDVPAYLAAMDIGSIPQSVNGMGSFRYTTKLSEYQAAGLPYITNQIPMAYDLDNGGLWRLPGDSPADPVFLNALARLMEQVTHTAIRAKVDTMTADAQFEKPAQVARATAFLRDVCDRVRAAR